MGTRELIVHELDHVPEQDLDKRLYQLRVHESGKIRDVQYDLARLVGRSCQHFVCGANLCKGKDRTDSEE